MVGVSSIALFGMLAAGVTASPTNFKRQTPSEEMFVFRSDLREGEGQSPMFKDLLLSVNSNAITFIPMDQRDNAAGGKVAGTNGVTLTTNTSGSVVVKTMVLGYNEGNPSAPQPVSLADTSNNVGEFVLAQNELRITPGSTTPMWDSWLICPGPTLQWLAQVPTATGGLLVTKPQPSQGCSIVRLFAERVEGLGSGQNGQDAGNPGSNENVQNSENADDTGNVENTEDTENSEDSGNIGNSANAGNSTMGGNVGNGGDRVQGQADTSDAIGSDICGNGGCMTMEEFCAAIMRNGQSDERCG
ncbi:MAG: hypothetical protein Q9215_003517 [Flavoplaca cf. flavocitrina]